MTSGFQEEGEFCPVWIDRPCNASLLPLASSLCALNISWRSPHSSRAALFRFEFLSLCLGVLKMTLMILVFGYLLDVAYGSAFPQITSPARLQIRQDNGLLTLWSPSLVGLTLTCKFES